MKNKAKFKWNNREIDQTRLGVVKGLLKMATAISSQARHNAPYLTGALSNSIRTTTDIERTSVYVLAGGNANGKRIRYAYIREFHNDKNPATKHYMVRAFNQITAGNITKYFKGVIG